MAEEKRDGLGVLQTPQLTNDAKGGDLILRPLCLSDYVSARSEALRLYKKEQLNLLTDNADSLRDAVGDAQYRQMLADKLNELSGISYEDLPDKEVVQYKDGQEHLPRKEREVQFRHIMEYGLWWISSEIGGQLFALWLSCTRDPSQADMTMEDMEERFQDESGNIDQGALERAAAQLGEMSQPTHSGNGEAGDAAAKKNRRRKRRKRRTG